MLLASKEPIKEAPERETHTHTHRGLRSRLGAPAGGRRWKPALAKNTSAEMTNERFPLLESQTRPLCVLITLQSVKDAAQADSETFITTRHT